MLNMAIQSASNLDSLHVDLNKCLVKTMLRPHPLHPIWSLYSSSSILLWSMTGMSSRSISKLLISMANSLLIRLSIWNRLKVFQSLAKRIGSGNSNEAFMA